MENITIELFQLLTFILIWYYFVLKRVDTYLFEEDGHDDMTNAPTPL